MAGTPRKDGRILIHRLLACLTSTGLILVQALPIAASSIDQDAASLIKKEQPAEPASPPPPRQQDPPPPPPPPPAASGASDGSAIPASTQPSTPSTPATPAEPGVVPVHPNHRHPRLRHHAQPLGKQPLNASILLMWSLGFWPRETR